MWAGRHEEFCEGRHKAIALLLDGNKDTLDAMRAEAAAGRAKILHGVRLVFMAVLASAGVFLGSGTKPGQLAMAFLGLL